MDALLQTLIGGFLALAGTFATPYFQRKHDRWIANRDDQRLMRDKAQELFDELDRVVCESQKASLGAIARITDKNIEPAPVPDLGRVRAIAAIYFLSSLKLIEDFETRHQKMAEMIIDEAKKAVDAGTDGLDTLKSLPMLMTANYQQFASEFVREMRSHLATNVPKMKLVD